MNGRAGLLFRGFLLVLESGENVFVIAAHLRSSRTSLIYRENWRETKAYDPPLTAVTAWDARATTSLPGPLHVQAPSQAPLV